MDATDPEMTGLMSAFALVPAAIGRSLPAMALERRKKALQGRKEKKRLLRESRACRERACAERERERRERERSQRERSCGERERERALFSSVLPMSEREREREMCGERERQNTKEQQGKGKKLTENRERT